MAISRANFWSFISEFIMLNPTVGIPALEDVLFCEFVGFQLFIGKRKRKTEGKIKRETGKGMQKGSFGKAGRLKLAAPW